MPIIADIVEALSGERPGWGFESIRGAVVDSRLAEKDSLFVAVPGEKTDGHDYVMEAFQKGSSLALIEKDQHNHQNILDLRKNKKYKNLQAQTPPFCILVDDTVLALQKIAKFLRMKLHPRVIGITGSVGKSTTKEVAADVLNQRFRTLKNPANLNNEIGLPLTLVSLDEHHQRVILEMGFYVPGEIALLCEIAKPHVGVVTNIGTVHAERAGSQEMIAFGKAELIKALPPAPEGTAILNYDDPWVRDMASLTDARIFFYGLDSKSDLWADSVEGVGLDGIRVRLHYQNDVEYMRVPLIGRHSVHTVLRATAIGLVEGLTWQEIVNGLRSDHAQLRLVPVWSKEGALILDDTYNASPESTIAALNLLEELDGHKIAVLGDMLELGPYERQGHRMVGIRVAEVVDELITVGNLGRIIASSAIQAGLKNTNVHEFETSEQAAGYLNGKLAENDVVLIKGSHGMYMDQIVGTLESRE